MDIGQHHAFNFYIVNGQKPDVLPRVTPLLILDFPAEITRGQELAWLIPPGLILAATLLLGLLGLPWPRDSGGRTPEGQRGGLQHRSPVLTPPRCATLGKSGFPQRPHL